MMLNAQVFKCINAGGGPCQTDLFATRLNHQLDHYVSWQPDPFAMATDAFQITWTKDSSGGKHGGPSGPSVAASVH